MINQSSSSTKVIYLICLWIIVPTMANGQFDNISLRTIDPEKYIYENLRENEYTYLTPVYNQTLQDGSGIIYHRAGASIVASNGVKWIELNTPEISVMNDMALNKNNELVVVVENDVGLFKKDQTGLYVYSSLLIEPIDDNLSSIDIFDDEWFITGDSLIYQLIDGKLDVVAINTGGNFLITLNNKLLRVDPLRGIYDISSDDLLVSTKDIIGEISGASQFKNSLILDSKNRGLFIWNPDLNNLRMFSDELRNIQVIYPLSNGLVGIGTASDGLFILSPEGKILKQITKEDGLATNNINSLFEDYENGIWVGTNNGLIRIEYLNPVKKIFESTEYGIVISLIEYEGSLYAGTTEGLFRDIQTKDSITKISEIVGYTYTLLQFGNELIAGTSSGMYKISKEGKVSSISEERVRWAIMDPGNSGRFFTAQANGIGIYEADGDEIVFRGMVSGIEEDIRSIGYDVSRDLLIAAARAPLIFHIENPIGDSEISTYDSLNGVISTVQIFNYGDRCLYGSQKGIMKFDFGASMFSFDSTFGEYFAGKSDAYRFFQDQQMNVWISSDGLVNRLLKKNSHYYNDSISLIKLPSSTYRAIYVESSGKAWMGGNDGLFVFDPTRQKKPLERLISMISDIYIDYDSLVYDGLNATTLLGDQIPFKQNDISFSFSAPTFDEGSVSYSFQLVGYDEKWSSWTTENKKEYTNLYEGDYTFRVKAMTKYKLSTIASIDFSILPPWQRTIWAYFGYLILFLVFGYIVYSIQKDRIEARQAARIKAQKAEIEKEKQISQKLRMVDKLKDEFLANTSHELRTPLNGIIGISESLIDQDVPPDSREIKENLSLVVASGKRLASMVDGILDYSKLRTANLELYKRPVDLKSLTDVIISMSRPLIKGHPVEIINSISDDIPQVWADENRVQQILYNLVGNAIKFTERGNITISATINNQDVIIEVADTGIGIDKNEIDTIFESYEQLSESVDRDYIGTGLGLTITKKLIELHDGKIWVESIPDKGSKFYFSLPVSKEQVTPLRTTIPEWTKNTKPTNGKPDINQKKGLNLLIVDDEPVNQKVLSNILEAEGFQISLASNGAKALELLEEIHPDLVLLDIMMPKMSGYEVCEKIRSKFLMSELPVIFISAKNQIKDMVEGLSYGANDYVTKPFSKEEFLARVHTHLNLYKINDSYSRFVPLEFLKLLERESIIDVNLGDQIEKTVTILFSDIRGYTTISEKMTPKENFDFLNRYLRKVGPAIRNNNGFISHYYGDGIMALFSTNPEDALKASLEIVSKVREFNKEIVGEGLDEIRIGIGLHSGPSMLGILGDERRMDASLVSDSVNIASRMEGLTKFYSASIIVSENTLRQIEAKDEYLHRFLGRVVVKGKSRTTDVIEIFEADEEMTRALKLKTRGDFEAGITNYLAKNFTEAAANFKKVIGTNPDDAAAGLYLKNSAKFMVEGVPEDWEGIENIQ